MKATIESTDIITSVDGQPARVWKGITLSGVPFLAFIPRLSVGVEEDASQFEQELLEMPAPRELQFAEVLVAFSMRRL